MSNADDARRAWFRREILPLEPGLRAYARRFSRSGAVDVEDLVHETFARLISYENWATLTNAPAFASRVLKNIAVDQRRREGIVAIESVADVEALSIGVDQPGPELDVLWRDELRLLADIVAQLPERLRQVFTLRKVYGLSHKQIADRLGLSVSTVEKHLAKSLRICSDELARHPRTETVKTGASWRARRHLDGKT